MKGIKIIILAVGVLYSCSKTEEIGPIINVGPSSFLEIKGNFYLSDPNGKASVFVPKCSNEVPVVIKYDLVGSNGNELSLMAGVTVLDNGFTVDQKISVVPDIYTVENIYLLSSNGITTHAVPNLNDPQFPYSLYVERPLPYELNLHPDETLIERPTLLCYTPQIFSYNGEVGFDGDSIELITLLFYTFTDCIDAIGIVVYGNEIIIPIVSDIPMGVPVPPNADININVYNDNVLQYVIADVMAGYNLDGSLDASDTITLNNPNCN